MIRGVTPCDSESKAYRYSDVYPNNYKLLFSFTCEFVS